MVAADPRPSHDRRELPGREGLGIHPNTFHQRLRRAADLSGFDLRDYRTVGTVVLALEWDRMLRARTDIEENSE